MSNAVDELPDDLASALALLAQERARRVAAEAEAATAKAEAASANALVSHSEALIARLKLEIDKVRRELYGSRSERKARLLEQMELQLEELEADAGEDELAAEIAAKASTVKAFERRRPSRKPFPEHLPRERVIIAAPANCACCGWHDPRDLRAENSHRKVGANDNESLPSARHGQNEPAMALGRKSWLFAGSDRGAERAAFMATLIMTAKLNDIDPQAWLADVLARIADTPITRLEQLLAWNWQQKSPRGQAA